MHQLTRLTFLRILATAAVLCSLVLRAQVISRQYQLKAVFLYRFAQFVEWPETAFPSPDSPIVIGVLGGDPFGPFLEEAVRGERVRNRPLTVQHFQRSQEARSCHLLFISTSEKSHLEKIFADLKGRSILTVGEMEDFALRGGMIQFITEQNHIRFRVNLKAVHVANLQISSKLLELAEVVSAQKE